MFNRGIAKENKWENSIIVCLLMKFHLNRRSLKKNKKTKVIYVEIFTKNLNDVFKNKISLMLCILKLGLDIWFVYNCTLLLFIT